MPVVSLDVEPNKENSISFIQTVIQLFDRCLGAPRNVLGYHGFTVGVQVVTMNQRKIFKGSGTSP